MTRRATPEELADHYRDLAKHDLRAPSHRLDRPISTAIEVVVAVKAMKNFEEAAKLIDDNRMDAVAAGSNP